MALLALANELLTQIISDKCLSSHDRKAVRATCTALEPIASHCLFQQICISKVKRDRDAFIGISRSPRLAPIPKQLTWYELVEDESVFGPDRHGWYKYDKELLDHLCAIAKEAFWFPICHPDPSDPKFGPIWAERKRIFAEFIPAFFFALDAMPGIHTFVSRSMPPHHIVSTDGYELEAHLFQSGSIPDFRAMQMSDGLFNILLPAMRRPESNIARLYWADELTKPSFMRLKTADLDSFRSLTSIDLCISHPGSSPTMGLGPRPDVPSVGEFTGLAACLRVATGLRDLRLCFEKAEHSDLKTSNQRLLNYLLIEDDYHWPQLTTLHLTEVPQPLLIRQFVQKHAVSLRHVSFMACGISRSDVLSLAGIPSLNLLSFRVGQDEDQQELVSEHALLDFLNKNTDNCPISKGTAFFQTSIFTWDAHAWPTVAYFDTKDGCKGHLNHYSSMDLDRIQDWAEHIDADDEVSSELGEDLDMIDVDEECSEASSIGGPGSAQFYDRRAAREADIRHALRSSNASTWRWGRQNNKIFYWSVEDGTGHPTKMWKFIRKSDDGTEEVGCGEDPLEFWSDWDSVEDKTDYAHSTRFLTARRKMRSEATPFGRDFARFVLARGLGETDAEIPANATWYDSNEDPVDYMTEEDWQDSMDMENEKSLGN